MDLTLQGDKAPLISFFRIGSRPLACTQEVNGGSTEGSKHDLSYANYLPFLDYIKLI